MVYFTAISTAPGKGNKPICIVLYCNSKSTKTTNSVTSFTVSFVFEHCPFLRASFAILNEIALVLTIVLKE
jgi:hypothetical protein